jgi:hypothetical protein
VDWWAGYPLPAPGGFPPTAAIGGDSIPTDGPGGVFTPTTLAEWTALSSLYPADVAVPTLCYACQDASGNAVPSIGSVELAPNGTGLSYRNAVAGWSRLALGLTDNASGGRWGTTDAVLDLAAGDSMYMLAYANVTVAGGNRRLLSAQADSDGTWIEATGVPRSLANTGFVSGTQNHLGATVHPIFYARDGAGNTSRTYTDLEQVNNTHSELARTGLMKCIGGSGAAACPTARVLLLAFWKNPSIALGKTLLQRLGWSLAY